MGLDIQISKIEQAASEMEFSGVISVFRDASTVFSKAFGYRDIKNKLPNTTSTLFGIASGTKVFTALGIGVLIDQGLISLGTTSEKSIKNIRALSMNTRRFSSC
jgi:CubicO group peptidase (beta-lactamase class C family)